VDGAVTAADEPSSSIASVQQQQVDSDHALIGRHQVVSPLSQYRSGPASPALQYRSNPASPRLQHHRMFRVLLAEDHAPTAKLMSMTLRKLGCEVTVVENGVMAINALKDEPSGAGTSSLVSMDAVATEQTPKFDIVFMDGNMPIVGKLTHYCTTAVVSLNASCFIRCLRWLSGNCSCPRASCYDSHCRVNGQCARG